MLTSYWVKCPQLGCQWTGSLLPVGDGESWKRSLPTTNVATFECPRCRNEWRARVHGDDVEAILDEELVAH